MRLTTSLFAAPCLLLILSAAACAQTSSGLTELEPSPPQCESLWKLGKVWGFLKYHHPLITQGDVDWDQALFSILPHVASAESEEAGLKAIGEWIELFPAPASNQPEPELKSGLVESPKTKEAYYLADLDWIHDRDAFGDSLCSYLEAVYEGRHRAGEQKYVKQGPHVGNPIFDDENPYAELEEIDAGFRLLALYRFWNIIQWWSPYRDLLDDDWDNVLATFVPRMLACESPNDYGLELMALAALVKDTHTSIWSMGEGVPPVGPLTLPVGLRFVGSKAVVWRELAEPTGDNALQRGDVLLEIDGRSVSDLVQELEPLYPASNPPTRLRGMATNLTRGADKDVRVRVERAGDEIEFLAQRTPRTQELARAARSRDLPGDAFRLLDDDVAYVKLSTAAIAESTAYIEKAEGTRGLVIDIRNYPKDFLVYALGGHLVSEPTPFATFTKCDLGDPGASFWADVVQLTPYPPHYQGKVVILVDESTQSRAEFTAMALEAVPGAVVVGSTTAGADGNASWFTLPGGHRSLLSGAGVFYPDRTPAQRVGVTVDVVCHPTAQGIREGRDEVLEEGIRQILGADVDAERLRRIAR